MMKSNQIKKPQVLLLGNGVNRAFNGESWGDLIKKINVRGADEPDAWESLKIPMPLCAILATNNNIKGAVQRYSPDFYGKIKNDEQKEILRKILALGFDDILTTNYSYELEAVALDDDTVSDNQLKKLMRSTAKKAENKYLLHTYYSLDFQGVPNRIWHIHGESRKPDSVIVGHYWYAQQLAKLKKESDNNGNRFLFCQEEGKMPSCKSWFDAFVLGDVYVLGLGFDFSEIDLWWLLNRKAQENAVHGKVRFYEMKNSQNHVKTDLLNLFDVDSIDFGMSEECKDYKGFIKKALADIEEKMQAARG